MLIGAQVDTGGDTVIGGLQKLLRIGAAKGVLIIKQRPDEVKPVIKARRTHAVLAMGLPDDVIPTLAHPAAGAVQPLPGALLMPVDDFGNCPRLLAACSGRLTRADGAHFTGDIKVKTAAPIP